MSRKGSSARKKRSYGTKRNPTESIGARLLQALTEKQLSGLLDALFELPDAEAKVLISSRVDGETAQILSLLGGHDPMERKLPATRAKCTQEWESVWRRWYELTAKLGAEDGPYVYQEHHWEAPSFDGDAFATDLDEVAEDMLPLIERVSELGIEDRNLFRDELLAIKTGVNSYPEWMGEGECTLGPATTTCFLKWEWRARSAKDGWSQELLERLRLTEEELMAVYFDDSAFTEFFISLPGDSQREIFDALRKIKTSAHWQERFSSPHSKWRRILNRLLARFDSDSYLEDCMSLLDEEWTYGLPLIEHFMKKNDLIRADEVLAKTFASLLSFGFKPGEEWIPEDELLVNKIGYHSPFPDARVVKLLAYGRAIAGRRGDEARAVTLVLQGLIYRDPFRWDEISGVFEKLLGSPHGGNARILLCQWENFMAEESISHLKGVNDELVDTWVHWLIEAGIDKAKGSKWFQKRLKEWFDFLKGDSRRFSKSRSQIIRLAGDLSMVSSLKKSYPQFTKLARDSEEDGAERCANARRAWLKKMDAESILPALISCVKKNASHLVPDPDKAYGSRYEEHAQWLRAVKEIDPVACEAIIDRWKVQHKRRRNLWDALKRAGMM